MSDRWSVHHAEVLDALASMPDNSACAALTDPPYGLGPHQPSAEELVAYLTGADLDMGGDFMGRDWNVPSVRVWREMFRVLKPGAPVLAFGGTRTVDLTMGRRRAGDRCVPNRVRERRRSGGGVGGGGAKGVP